MLISTNVHTNYRDARKIHNLFTIKAIQHIDKQVVLCYDTIELKYQSNVYLIQYN